MSMGVMIALLLAASSNADDKAMIQRLDDQFGARAKAGDAAGIAALYAPDAVLLPPEAPMIEGHDRIRDFWAKAGTAVTDVKLTAVRVRRLGPDTVEEIGTYAERTKATPSRALQGKYLVIWRKVAGEWKLQRDMWN